MGVRRKGRVNPGIRWCRRGEKEEGGGEEGRYGRVAQKMARNKRRPKRWKATGRGKV